MRFAITKEISDGLGKNVDKITELAIKLKEYFADKTYGEGLKEIYIGFICVRQEYEFFFNKQRRKYTKGKRVLEYDLKIDFEEFKRINENEVKKLILDKIVASLEIVQELKVPNFDLKKFIEDLIDCANK